MSEEMNSEVHRIPGTKYTLTQRYALPHEKYARRKRTDFLVVHCADTPPTMDIGVKEIREWHLANGWIDVGYHFIIRRNGNIETGRPAWAVGSGVFGHNAHTMHLCLVGGKGGDNFTADQKDALLFMLNTLRVQPYERAEVCGHRDFKGVDKTCPSFDAKAWFAAETKKAKKGLVA